jgi:AAHS family 4-hydroxybenzoate transporter-like MFS transporter
MFINLGSFVATITIGRLMDKFNPFRSLIFAFVIAFFTVVAFGFSAGSTFIIVAIVSIITGMFIFAGNSGLMALATISYPVDIRGSGLGWAYAIGKIGAMIAPVTGGILLGWQWSTTQICALNAVSGLLIAVVIVILSRHVAGAAAKS